jgi:hypothetical protein
VRLINVPSYHICNLNIELNILILQPNNSIFANRIPKLKKQQVLYFTGVMFNKVQVQNPRE